MHTLGKIKGSKISYKFILGIGIVLICSMFISCSPYKNTSEKGNSEIVQTQLSPTPGIESTQNKDSNQNADITPTLNPSQKIELPNNIFDLSTVKNGETYGEMIVDNVKSENNYTTVDFTGDITISGTYSSDWQGMFGEYITLILDEKSMAKIPVLNDQQYNIVLDPVIKENKDIIKEFGETGTTGTFKIKISKFTVTNYTESFTRTAGLSEIIDVKAD